MARSSFLYNFYRTRLILYKKGFELFRNYKRGLRVGCPKKNITVNWSVRIILFINPFLFQLLLYFGLGDWVRGRGDWVRADCWFC